MSNPSLPNRTLVEEPTPAFADPAAAEKLLLNLAGNGVTDDDLAPLLPKLLESLRESPDPDRSLSSFAHWFAAVGSPFSHLQILLHHPVALNLFCLITGCSQYFADLLTRHPEYIEILTNPGVRGGTKTAARFDAEAGALVNACQRPELKKDALRRWKAREMLRIGVRDLARLADMPATAREFSNLADACVRQALQIALSIVPAASEPSESQVPFAVIAMGKLGGQELNYSSDIDLMFLVADALPPEILLANGRRTENLAWLTRLGETLIKVLNEETASGHVFRVDMRLRPEGRFGPLVRTLGSYEAYYENWAESWERQALLKARFVAGDALLGADYMRMLTPFVFRPYVSAEFVEEVRANKRKIEQKAQLEGGAETNVKTGYGGIRDIEFIVQLLQLELGGRSPNVRTPNTLSAIQRLRHARALTRDEARELSVDYQFLRTLEHRLQLLHGFQTQTMPSIADERERTFLGRRMGYPGRAAFERDLRARRDRVRNHLDRLFYGERPDAAIVETNASGDWSDLAELLDNLDSPAATERLISRLQESGFRDVPAALQALRLPMRGNEFGGMPADTPVEFKAIAPRLLTRAAASAQPDAALAGIEALALAVPNRAQLYASMDESPELLDCAVVLAAAAPPLMNRLTHRLEWMETVFSVDDDAEDALGETGANRLLPELMDRLRQTRDSSRRIETLASFTLRETLLIGAHDAWREYGANETMLRLTQLAEAVLKGLFQISIETVALSEPDPALAREVLSGVAAIGLGKLGGGELGYASDWDVVFVYDGQVGRNRIGAHERGVLAHRLVEAIHNSVPALRTLGTNIEIDVRLRPWGKKGALVFTPRAYLQYLREAGETWERQAGVKARAVAGSLATGRRMEHVFRANSFGRGVTPDEIGQIVAMKRRIETERLKPAERETDLKLGLGGLLDIEWLVQRLQMEHGRDLDSLRVPGTRPALEALGEAGLIPETEAHALTESYQFLTWLRNGLWLLTGRSLDVLADPAHLRALARRLEMADAVGMPADARLRERVAETMRETRSIFERRFLPLPGA